MRIHILGICGTFMSGVALLAKEHGFEVSGSDANVYPPMSTQLVEQGIKLYEGYDPNNIEADIDCIVVGNVIRRGNPCIEYVLSKQIPYYSGPEWLSANILRSRWVLAVAGTHGKTTTSSMLTWILQSTGHEPGFLIGGIPENFGISARLGKAPFFVIEADEYDSSFFDKRSKFIHYRPKTLILNNLEYDHADIFPNLQAIKTQFHHLLKTIPGNGEIIANANDENLNDVVQMGVWTPIVKFGKGGEWQAELKNSDGSCFSIWYQHKETGQVNWDLLGVHNVDNALAAIAAAVSIGVDPSSAIDALANFKNVKRRMEVKGKVKDIVIYDDFAHHPTAIATTLSGLRSKIGQTGRMIAVIEFGSYTMKQGVHKDQIQNALKDADIIICKQPETDWGLEKILKQFSKPTSMYNDIEGLVNGLVPQLKAGDHVVVMSNSGFGGIHNKLLSALRS